MDQNTIISKYEDILNKNSKYTMTGQMNIISNEEIDDYDDNSLIKYEDKLNKLVYTFKNNQLISLSK